MGVVTGHSREGAACIAIDDRRKPSDVGRDDARFALVWTTSTVPADNNDEADGATREVGIALQGGSVIRIGDLAPGCASTMHRSNSIDYGITGKRPERFSGNSALVFASCAVIRTKPSATANRFLMRWPISREIISCLASEVCTSR
ncbi:hypothetical protein [Bradyrhizobium sp. BR13661]|jgi:hypothetical protein|uniref:hypothetical protein n=1 Tax=Bradyrhizobium sp. BR13661 TaxID=2940622 RepID=UPI0024759F9F|nr:hypothetical protein [Bradyrhizobium sp. BR13661]MDH6261801.1 hypothetical protein [Bradyrhizobium sp. BR13661]